MPLTDRTVRYAKAREKPYYLADGDGLYLKVAPTGRLTWMRRSQRIGDRTWKKVGEYPTMSLLQARMAVSELRNRGPLPPTVREAYRDYRKLLDHNYERAQDIEDRFNRDILPKLGDRHVDQITKTDCSDLLLAIVARGSPVAANRTLPDLKHFLEWCCERGWLQKSPAAGITRKSVGGRERPRSVALELNQVSAFIRDLLDPKRHPCTRLALAFQLCVGQRSSEILGISKAEISGCWWKLPAERTKSRRAHKVYLSPQARAVLRAAFSRFGPAPFASLDHLVLSRALGRASERLGFRFTPHDLRRTMATRLSDLGVAPHVVEKMLNHQMSGVWAVYNHGEYLPERRAAWRLWGVTIAALRRQREETIDSLAIDRLRVDRAGEVPGAERARSVLDALQRPGAHAGGVLPESR